MARQFLSPGEKAALASLPLTEAMFVREIIDTFDARLVSWQEPVRAAKEGESEAQVVRQHHRPRRHDAP